jgi:hypothetical protein
MNDTSYYPPIHVEYRRRLAAKKARRSRRRTRGGQGRMEEWRPNFWAVASSSTHSASILA